MNTHPPIATTAKPYRWVRLPSDHFIGPFIQACAQLGVGVVDVKEMLTQLLDELLGDRENQYPIFQMLRASRTLQAGEGRLTEQGAQLARLYDGLRVDVRMLLQQHHLMYDIDRVGFNYQFYELRHHDMVLRYLSSEED